MQTHINIFGEAANGVHINKINDNYLARYSEKVVGEHRDKEELDHPEGSVRTRHIAGGAVTLEKIADGAITEDKLSLDVKRIIEHSGWAVTTITLADDVYSVSNGAGAQGQIIVVQNGTGRAIQYVSLENYSMRFDRYISIGEIVICRCTSMGHDGATYETIMTLYVDEKVASSDILDGAVGMSKLDEEVIEKLNELKTAMAEEVEARQTLDKNLTAEINSKADDIHEHTMADITDLGDKITDLETAIDAEATARQTADEVLEKRIEVVELGGIGGGSGAFSNCFNPLETYDSENVITDINGNIYVGQSMEFEGIYANYTINANKFAKAIEKGNVELKLGFAHLHMGIDECDMGGFVPYESSLTISYADGTTEIATFGEGGENISVEHADSNKDITFVEGYPEGYNYSLYTFKFENTKDITGIKFSLIFDNNYAETPADGGACIQNVYVDTLTCYDDECVVTREMLGEQSGTSITVDSELSETSENPVQNKVVKAELDKKYEIPNENADWLLQEIGIDSSGNALQINTDLFVPYFYAGNDGGYVTLENVACLEFKDSNGFKDIDEITQAILDLQDRVSALEG